MAQQFSSVGFTYEVFLSFRGIDTRRNFTGNLYKALTDKGIHTFMDDSELQGGEEITPSLLKAIENSRIAIIVFSENYASSSFCLDELVKIIDVFNVNDRLVLPVFYGVEPTHLRYHTGSYGIALAQHEKKLQSNIEKLQKWKIALNQAANLSGHTFDPTGKEYEYEFIGKIVDKVSNKISRTPLHVAEFRVGLESRLLKVKSLLNMRSNEGVSMVGIHGIGGIGKTTLAREIYNSIANQFEGSCFLDDLREKTHQHGLVHLQETLLHETIRDKDIKFGSVSKGISIIKQRLHTKKVLLILDDVDDLKQLEALVGGCDWYGPGSKVIITTRDQHLLKIHGIEKTYEVEVLNKDEALELLMWKTFKNNNVDSSYEDVLNSVVTYASGLPLALEVVGSNLCGKHIEEWDSTLDRYKRGPHKMIQKILQVSFDTLEKDEQSVFLDIACCLRGYDLSVIKDILHAHYGECMNHHIEVLVEKSLVKISQRPWFDTKRVTLHDLIVDMGKNIVLQESPKEPGKRSRLWLHEDIVRVLEDNTGTNNIEIINLDCASKNSLVDWNGKAFEKMKLQDMGLDSELDKALLRNEWIHAQVEFSNANPYHVGKSEEVFIESGIHVFKHKTSMDDIRFTNPYEGYVKVSCVVVFCSESDATACGGILQDHLGSFLGGFAGQIGQIQTLHAELKAILYSVKFAWNKCYRKIIVESKSRSAIQMLKMEIPTPGSCRYLVREIQIFANSADQVVWSHTSSNENREAYLYAIAGLKLSWKDGIVSF